MLRKGFLWRWSLPLFAAAVTSPATAQEFYTELREQMVIQQLQARDIDDPATLQAMLTVPRHLFVPHRIRRQAYEDRALSIGEGQTISQPYIVAFMTQVLQAAPGDRVLEVGTGSGYQAAVLSEMGAQVYTIEIVETLAERARKRLDSLGYTGIVVRSGDGYHGWEAQAPFDAIIVTAGAERIPKPLWRQLKEGGRMVIPVGPHRGIRQLQLLVRRGNSYRSHNLMQVRFVPFTRSGH